jgi:uncharacterized membrane protein
MGGFMPFCAICGAPVEGRFCAKCGAPAAAGAGPAGPAPGAPMGAPPPIAAGAPMADNVVAALCYAFTIITGILFLVIAPYNQNRVVRFHAFQAIFFFVAAFVIRVALGILFLVINGLGLFGLFGLWSLVGLGFFILWVYMIITAYQGRTVVLPVIGKLAQQQA